METFYYSSLPGIPKKLKWPVKVLDWDNNLHVAKVYSKSDDAFFDVCIDQLLKFPSIKVNEKSRGMLAKKPKTLQAFIADVEWAKSNSKDDNCCKRKNEQEICESADYEDKSEKSGIAHDRDRKKRRSREISGSPIHEDTSENKSGSAHDRGHKKRCSREISEHEIHEDTSENKSGSAHDRGHKKRRSGEICENEIHEDTSENKSGSAHVRGRKRKRSQEISESQNHEDKRKISSGSAHDRGHKKRSSREISETEIHEDTSENESGSAHDRDAKKRSSRETNESENYENTSENKSESAHDRDAKKRSSQETNERENHEDERQNSCESAHVVSLSETDAGYFKGLGQNENKNEVKTIQTLGIEKDKRFEVVNGNDQCEKILESTLKIGEKVTVKGNEEVKVFEQPRKDKNSSNLGKLGSSKIGEMKVYNRQNTAESKVITENASDSCFEDLQFASDIDDDSYDNTTDDPDYIEKEESSISSDSEVITKANHCTGLDYSEVECSTSDSECSTVYRFLQNTPVIVPRPINECISESDDEGDEYEDDIVRDSNCPGIYVTKVLKSCTSKTGRNKKSDRVYNSKNVCPFCFKQQTNLSHHLLDSKEHLEEKEVKEILKLNPRVGDEAKKREDGNKRKNMIELLRLRGNHKHNMEVIAKKKGELKLARRNNKECFNHLQYSPCPTCFGWMLGKTLKRHAKKCPGSTSEERKLISSSVSLSVQSDIITGRIPMDASKALVREVFTIMQNDSVSKVAKADKLLVNLGNQWLKRNMGNRVMRKYYTSQVMRLGARLLIEIRKDVGEDVTLEEVLTPSNFNRVADAALVCAKQNMDDDEKLDAPSNALKLGYDIKRMASAKLATAIVDGNEEKRKEAKNFLSLMNMQWGLKVTKQARVILNERQFNKKSEMPLPEDIEKLSRHMDNELMEFNDGVKTLSNYRHGGTYTLAKLTLYNRRRCHEVQALRLDTYSRRTTGYDSVTAGLCGELTEWEKHLIETQEVVEIRGKRGRPVPVIIPEKAKKVLEFLVSPTIRKAVGVPSSNPYVFGIGGGVLRAYDAIRRVTDVCELLRPELIRTTSMRKYMATMVQSLETTETQRQWIVDHMGHTMNIHLTHYRQTSDILERVEVAKLLLIQDSNRVNEFAGKKLADIQFDDIVDDNQNEPYNEIDSGEPEVVPDLYRYEEEEETLLSDKAAPKRPREATTRSRWSDLEEEELKMLFGENFVTLKCPNTKEIKKAMKISKDNKGHVHSRKLENIKKKVSNMLIKIRKKKGTCMN